MVKIRRQTGVLIMKKLLLLLLCSVFVLSGLVANDNEKKRKTKRRYGYSLYAPTTSEQGDMRKKKKKKKRKKKKSGMKRKREGKNKSKKRRKHKDASQINHSNIMIILNGTTSAGKTTVMKNVKKMFDNTMSWIYLSRDDQISNEYVAALEELRKRKYPYEKEVIRPDSKQNLARITRGECQNNATFKDNHMDDPEVVGMYEKVVINGLIDKAIKSYDQGYNIFFDAAFLGGTPEYEAWMLQLAKLIKAENYKAFFVKVYCSLYEAKRRTRDERNDRRLDLPEKQFPIIHTFSTTFKKYRKRYDYFINTQHGKTETLVKKMIHELSQTEPCAINHNAVLIRQKNRQQKAKKIMDDSIGGLEAFLRNLDGTTDDAQQTCGLEYKSKWV